MRRQKIPKRIVPYLQKEPVAYSQEAIDAFHAVTARGEKAPPLPWGVLLDYDDLLRAHLDASNDFLERQWLEAHFSLEFGLGMTVQDILRDLIAEGAWPRRREFFLRALRLHKRICPDHHEFLLSVLRASFPGVQLESEE